MSAPNVEGTTNPAVLTGGVSGQKVGTSPTSPIGFFGSTGTTRVTSASLADLTALKAYLVSLGLLS